MDGVGCMNLKTVEVDLETFFQKIYRISALSPHWTRWTDGNGVFDQA
jgi:hypothetical protein